MKTPTEQLSTDGILLKVNSKSIDRVVLASLIISVLSFASTCFRDLATLRFKLEEGGLFQDLMLRGGLPILIIGGLLVSRTHLSVRLKCTMLAIASTITFIWGISNFGQLAAAKGLIIFIPMLLTITFSRAVTIPVLMVMVGIFFLVGMLFTTGALEFNRLGGPAEFITQPMNWFHIFLFLVSVAFGLRYIASTEEEALLSSITESASVNSNLELASASLLNYKNNLQEMVKEKTGELEKVNNQLRVLNDALGKRNRQILREQGSIENILEERQVLEARLAYLSDAAAIGRLSIGKLNAFSRLLESDLDKSPTRPSGATTVVPLPFSGPERKLMSTIVSSLSQVFAEPETADEAFDLVQVIRELTMYLRIVKPCDFFEPELPSTPVMVIGRRTELQLAIYDLLEVAHLRRINSGVIRVQVIGMEKEVKLKISQTVSNEEKETVKQDSMPREWERIVLNACHEIFKAHSGSLHISFDNSGRYEWEARLPVRTDHDSGTFLTQSL